MVDVYISLGSNVERELNLRKGLGLLETHFGTLCCSSAYESEAIGFSGDPFLNLVTRFETDADVYDVSRVLKDIEVRCGRLREGSRYSPRTLDLDLLLFGELVLRENGLQLPRDEITTHAFVLKPLSEIAGDVMHPTMGQTFKDLWAAFDHDTQTLETIELEFLANR